MQSTTKKVLIIEDEKPMARAVQLKLQHAGFDAVVVHNGLEALKLMKDGGWSLILMDLMMPKMDGFKMLETLQKQKDKTPVVVLSNLSQEEDINRAKGLGAKAFFIKSNTPIIEIVDQAKELLGSP